MTASTLSAVLERHGRELLGHPDVVGVAEGETDTGRPCILVLVARALPDGLGALPAQIESHPVVVRVVGRLEAGEA